MSLVRIAAPSSEPVSLAEAKLHCKVDSDLTADDALITALIVAVREQAEQELRGVSIGAQTWERTLDAFPSDEIELGMPPVTGIVSVKYLDAAGAEQTIASNLYTLDAATAPGWLLPAADADWPDTGDYANAVRVRFTCGIVATADLATIKAWILLHVAEWYASREAASEKPRALLAYAERLLDRWRNWCGMA